MARPPRLQPPGGIHHVTARSNRGLVLFGGDRDYRLFAGLMSDTARDYSWSCLAWCLMPNHLHLLVRPADGSLSSGMQRLLTAYARHFNDERGRYGHVFQGRFASSLVATDAHLRSVVRYIALNPVRAELCSSPSEWQWSSHRGLAGNGAPGLLDVTATLAWFDGASETYRKFVEAKDNADNLIDIASLAAITDRDTVILRGHDELGESFSAIAQVLGCHRASVGRRYAVLVDSRNNSD